MLILSLGNTSHLIAQSKPYCFTPLQVKELAYKLESRDLLIRDTIRYRDAILLRDDLIYTKDSIIASMESVLSANKYFIGVLQDDVVGLDNENDALRKQNKKLRLKVSFGKYAIPISLGGGVLLGYMLFK